MVLFGNYSSIMFNQQLPGAVSNKVTCPKPPKYDWSRTLYKGFEIRDNQLDF